MTCSVIEYLIFGFNDECASDIEAVDLRSHSSKEDYYS